MRTIMGEKLSEDEIQVIIRDIDMNGDGELDYEGWMYITSLYNMMYLYSTIQLEPTHLEAWSIYYRVLV